MTRSANGFAAAVALLSVLAPVAARADKIKHPTAVFAGLDKITGRVISFEVSTDETVQFGSLQITPRACFTRPPTETPQTDGFIEVEEVETDNRFKRIFSGWMYAASPGLHGIEHPVYDVWLTDCKGGTQIIADAAATVPEEALDTTLGAPPKPGTTPRPRQTRTGAANPNQPGLPAGLPGQPSGIPGQPQTAGPLTAPGPLDPPRPRANVPSQTAVAPPAPRRSPIQSFFPTAANPGDNARERDLSR